MMPPSRCFFKTSCARWSLEDHNFTTPATAPPCFAPCTRHNMKDQIEAAQKIIDEVAKRTDDELDAKPELNNITKAREIVSKREDKWKQFLKHAGYATVDPDGNISSEEDDFDA